MIILHDQSGGDLAHIQAIADIEEGFSLYDYVRIEQQNGAAWIGQVVQPNMNISTVGDRLSPTILHGLSLMQEHQNVHSVESVQVFDLLLLGQYDQGQLLTPRVRPLPGSVVTRLDAERTIEVIELPAQAWRGDGSSNVVGELLNADQVPLCINVEKYNYHIMIAGGTGSGKSNAAANFIDQALLFGKCVLLHDAKPDYRFVDRANTDPNVRRIWARFAPYNLEPHGAANLTRIGFHGRCHPDNVDVVVGFHASDFAAEMLAGYLFSEASEQQQYESFASAAQHLAQQSQDAGGRHYSLDDILGEVRRRMASNDPQTQIHQLTGNAILQKVGRRRQSLPWLDAVGQQIRGRSQNRLVSSRLDRGRGPVVEAFALDRYVAEGHLLVIDYSMMDEQSYALILSYFLRVSQDYRRRRATRIGIVQMVDEAHRVFDNESRHEGTLARAFARAMREGRSVDHSIILSLQNASQIPPRVMNNLNTKVVMRQNSKYEADAATQTMGKEFSAQAMRLGTGHALVSVHEARATVLAQMAPSPYELMRTDNTVEGTYRPTSASAVTVESPEDDGLDIPF